jgi:CheY-like chemotaxis protein
MPDELAAETRKSGPLSHGESDELATTRSTTAIRYHRIDDEDSSHKHHHILVVEDNLVNQEITRAMLKSLGYETKSAVDGNEALRAMSLENFDLILMDCHMPGLDGYATTEEIRRQEKHSSCTRRIPIVAVTADFLQGNRQRCLDCGMDDYMSKPFTQAQLRKVVTKWLTDSGVEEPTRPTLATDGRSILGDSSHIASINRQSLEEIRELDPDNVDDLLREIVVTFCASSTKLMVQLRSALSEDNADAVGHIAHSLKGASSQIGATLLALLCEQLVAAARNDNLSNAPTLVEQAAIEHFAVIHALDKEVQSTAA